MGDNRGAFFDGDVDHVLGDNRAGQRGAQQVAAFVFSVPRDSGKYEVAGEFFLHVDDVAFATATI